MVMFFFDEESLSEELFPMFFFSLLKPVTKGLLLPLFIFTSYSLIRLLQGCMYIHPSRKFCAAPQWCVCMGHQRKTRAENCKYVLFQRTVAKSLPFLVLKPASFQAFQIPISIRYFCYFLSSDMQSVKNNETSQY